MDPVSNVDRLMLVLRERLLERARLQASGKSARGNKPRERAPTGLEKAQALAEVRDVTEQQLKRALIQGVLADQFGQGLVNEAGFQQMVDRVTEALEATPDLRDLLSRVAMDLRTGAA